MKIGVLSDTHDRMEIVRAAVQAFRTRGVEYVIHCGDIVSPFVLTALRAGDFKKCFAVFGNNDGEWLFLSKLFEPLGTIVKAPAFPMIGDLRVAILHEPFPMDVMESMPVDIVAFGHTHEIMIKPGKPLIMNPGECCGYLTKRCTVVVVDSETLETELIDLGGAN